MSEWGTASFFIPYTLFDSNANLLKILYNVVDEQNLKVFHAMKCRDELLPLLDK